MANQEHLAILEQGVEVWNQWRKEHADIVPDLSGANLREAVLVEASLWKANLEGASLEGANLNLAHLSETTLCGANLSRTTLLHASMYRVVLSKASLNNAQLSWTDLRDAKLDEADLRGANLYEALLGGASFQEADLRGANLHEAQLNAAKLSGANLQETDLRFANLTRADLSRADLRKVVLIYTNFNRAILDGANFSNAVVAETIFAAVDFRRVKGLETVKHAGSSRIDIDTIILSHGNIPEIFLHRAGVPDAIIEQIPTLIGSLKPIDYYSCFISYSSKDQSFAERLHTDLRSKGVRCWFAPHDLRPGTVILRGVDEAIHVHDKLLLILSNDSVASNWVEHEVDIALFKEMQRKRQDVLFPIRVDNAVLESSAGWAADLRHRHISDFTRWKNHDQYQKAFTRLLRDLKAEV